MKQDFFINSDGGSRGNPGEAAYGFVIYDQNKKLIFEKGERIGINTNNVAEYMGVISALRWIKENSKVENPNIDFFLDSELVTSQLNGAYKVKNENLRNLFFTARNLIEEIKGNVKFTAIRRESNTEADKMVNLALDGLV